MPEQNNQVVDAHMHVGLLGDRGWSKNLGVISKEMQGSPTYWIMLKYLRIDGKADDDILLAKTLEAIQGCHIDQVVCLALDKVYGEDGRECPEKKSHMWVSHRYIIEHLRRRFPKKVLLGASVHPYASDFTDRLKKSVEEEGAVLMKWLPSAQQINLAHPKTGKAMKALARAGKNGKPLPLLLHVGPEYAIMTDDPRTTSYNFLCWTNLDRFWNLFRFSKRWHKPAVQAIRTNLRAALDEGAIIIFAHCGLPYFVSGLLAKLFEHSDLDVVREHLGQKPTSRGGRCLADVSAIMTPFRKAFFEDIKKLDEARLVFGSDFPTPVFELSADIEENLRDLKAVLKGKGEGKVDLSPIVIPQGNLIDVNRRELGREFGPNHPMFTNFARLFL